MVNPEDADRRDALVAEGLIADSLIADKLVDGGLADGDVEKIADIATAAVEGCRQDDIVKKKEGHKGKGSPTKNWPQADVLPNP